MNSDISDKYSVYDPMRQEYRTTFLKCVALQTQGQCNDCVQLVVDKIKRILIHHR